MLKIPAECDRDTSPENLTDIFLQVFFPASLLGVSADICQRALVDKSGIIRTRLGTHNILENGRSSWDTLFDTAP
jgi:hypothetical protein